SVRSLDIQGERRRHHACRFRQHRRDERRSRYRRSRIPCVCFGCSQGVCTRGCCRQRARPTRFFQRVGDCLRNRGGAWTHVFSRNRISRRQRNRHIAWLYHRSNPFGRVVRIRSVFDSVVGVPVGKFCERCFRSFSVLGRQRRWCIPVWRCFPFTGTAQIFNGF